MERHHNLVTQRLAAGVVQDIATLIEVYKVYPQDQGHAQLRRIAQEKLGLVVDFLPVNELPPPGPKPFFSLVDQALSERRCASRSPGRFWIDTVGRSALVESASGSKPYVAVFAPRGAAYVSELHIFLAWAGRHVAGADHRRVPAQPDPADPAARRRRGGFGKGREVPDLHRAARARSAARRRLSSR